MYRAGIEGILGIRREGDRLVLDPCLPDAWPEFAATLNLSGTRYEITVYNRATNPEASYDAMLDGLPLKPERGQLRVPLDGGTHILTMQVPRKSPPAHSEKFPIQPSSKLG
jgi:cyclic beta-1,2-glucan synthetase